MLWLTSENNVSDPSLKYFSQKTQEFLGQISHEAVLNPNFNAAGKSEIDEYNTVYGWIAMNALISHWLILKHVVRKNREWEYIVGFEE